MGALEELQCSRCGSVDLEEVSPDRFRCTYCGCYLQRDVPEANLTVDHRRCPECGQVNEPHASYCGRCGFRMVRACPRCAHLFRWDMTCCPRCGFRQDPDERFVCLLQGGLGQFWVLTSKKLYHRVTNALVEVFESVPLESVKRVRYRKGIFSNKLKVFRNGGRNMVILSDGNEQMYRHLRELTESG